jgi:hypothetical protein
MILDKADGKVERNMHLLCHATREIGDAHAHPHNDGAIENRKSCKVRINHSPLRSLAACLLRCSSGKILISEAR